MLPKSSPIVFHGMGLWVTTAVPTIAVVSMISFFWVSVNWQANMPARAARQIRIERNSDWLCWIAALIFTGLFPFLLVWYVLLEKEGLENGDLRGCEGNVAGYEIVDVTGKGTVGEGVSIANVECGGAGSEVAGGEGVR